MITGRSRGRIAIGVYMLYKVARALLPLVLFFAAVSIVTTIMFGVPVFKVALACTLFQAVDKLLKGRLS